MASKPDPKATGRENSNTSSCSNMDITPSKENVPPVVNRPSSSWVSVPSAPRAMSSASQPQSSSFRFTWPSVGQSSSFPRQTGTGASQASSIPFQAMAGAIQPTAPASLPAWGFPHSAGHPVTFQNNANPPGLGFGSASYSYPSVTNFGSQPYVQTPQLPWAFGDGSSNPPARGSMGLGSAAGFLNQIPSNVPKGAENNRPMQILQSSLGFSQWANAPSAYSAVGNTFGQPVTQDGGTPSLTEQVWKFVQDNKPVSPPREKQMEADKASVSSISLPFRESNATSMVVHTPSSKPLIIPTEQTERTHAVASSTGVCKIEQEEEGEIIEYPRAPESEKIQRHVVFTVPQPPKHSFPNLGSLELRTLDDNKILFYFGVLATQELLLPRFQFSVKDETKFGARLTMYGHTFPAQHHHANKADAKVGICREALKKLKPEYSRWTVPGEPWQCPIPSGWNWVELLRDYCIQNALPGPVYKEYALMDGYRHEVKIEGCTYFGTLNHYEDEWESTNATAHTALHSLLVFGDVVSGPFILRKSKESMLARVPRDLQKRPVKSKGKKRILDDVDVAALPCIAVRRSKRIRMQRQMSQQLTSQDQEAPGDGNANLVPLANSRLSAIETPPVEDKSKWDVTPREIECQIERLKTHQERLEKTCHLLSLEYPEIKVEKTESNREWVHKVAAYFHNDPFLARVGAIGQFMKVIGQEKTAREVCAKEVVKYLINMVREDTALENEVAEEERDRVESWRQNYDCHDSDMRDAD